MINIRQALLVGGVHGNELNGIFLVKKFEQSRFRHLIQRSHVKTSTMLANPGAIAICQRYVDLDLNRCFRAPDLSDSSLQGHEHTCAKAIAQTLKHRSPDFLMDLHTTTANMGLTLLLGSHHPFNLALAAYLCEGNEWIKVLQVTSTQADGRLRSLCPLGLTLEAGPIAQGTFDAHLFFKTEQTIFKILDYINAWNQGKPLTTPNTLTIYDHIETLDFPRSATGDIDAMVHPQLHGNDYHELHPGDPLFMGFDGKVTRYEGPNTVYPVFIQESAYLEKGIALYLTTRRHVSIPDISSL